jgi:hypothetical protein
MADNLVRDTAEGWKLSALSIDAKAVAALLGSVTWPEGQALGSVSSGAIEFTFAFGRLNAGGSSPVGRVP